MTSMHFSDNSKQNEYQGPPKLFKIYPVHDSMERSFVFQTIHTPQGCKIWHQKTLQV
jgi:hypothetical protein